MKVNSLIVLAKSILIAIVLTGASYLIAFEFGWITQLNWLEVFSVFTSYSCTYMCVMQSRWNYPMGAISTAALSYLFYTQGLFASAILNAYLVPVLVYGWIRWRSDSNTRPVTHVKWVWWPFYLIGTGILWALCTHFLDQFHATLALTDSLILIGSILAQFLLDNKKLENWYVWAIVNVIAIYTYFTAGLPLVALQFVFFLGNTIWGWYAWKRSMKNG